MSSRLGLFELPFEQKSPIILPHCPHVVALIRGVHLENNPSGVVTTVTIICQPIRIPGLKGLAVYLKHSCFNCQCQHFELFYPPVEFDSVFILHLITVQNIIHIRLGILLSCVSVIMCLSHLGDQLQRSRNTRKNQPNAGER